MGGGRECLTFFKVLLNKLGTVGLGARLYYSKPKKDMYHRIRVVICYICSILKYILKCVYGLCFMYFCLIVGRW